MRTLYDLKYIIIALIFISIVAVFLTKESEKIDKIGEETIAKNNAVVESLKYVQEDGSIKFFDGQILKKNQVKGPDEIYFYFNPECEICSSYLTEVNSKVSKNITLGYLPFKEPGARKSFPYSIENNYNTYPILAYAYIMYVVENEPDKINEFISNLFENNLTMKKAEEKDLIKVAKKTNLKDSTIVGFEENKDAFYTLALYYYEMNEDRIVELGLDEEMKFILKNGKLIENINSIK